jgi:hypothetical protein
MRHITHVARAVILVVSGLVVALSLAGPAAAITPCGERVLNDWWDNGRVDRLYPLHCYEEAIDGIPKDIRDYSDAQQVISRALQAAVGGKLAPGGSDPTPEGSGSGEREPGAPVPGGPDPGDGEGATAAPEVDGSGTSSVPIPLLVLGGMSLALLAAGGLGYLSRRRQAADGLEDESDPLI